MDEDLDDQKYDFAFFGSLAIRQRVGSFSGVSLTA